MRPLFWRFYVRVSVCRANGFCQLVKWFVEIWSDSCWVENQSHFASLLLESYKKNGTLLYNVLLHIIKPSELCSFYVWWVWSRTVWHCAFLLNDKVLDPGAFQGTLGTFDKRDQGSPTQISLLWTNVTSYCRGPPSHLGAPGKGLLCWPPCCHTPTWISLLLEGNLWLVASFGITCF